MRSLGKVIEPSILSWSVVIFFLLTGWLLTQLADDD